MLIEFSNCIPPLSPLNKGGCRWDIPKFLSERQGGSVKIPCIFDPFRTGLPIHGIYLFFVPDWKGKQDKSRDRRSAVCISLDLQILTARLCSADENPDCCCDYPDYSCCDWQPVRSRHYCSSCRRARHHSVPIRSGAYHSFFGFVNIKRLIGAGNIISINQFPLYF